MILKKILLWPENHNYWRLLFTILFVAYLNNALSQSQLTTIVSETGDKSSSPSSFIKLDDLILFTALTESQGYALWVTDGTAANTSIVKDISPSFDVRNHISLSGAVELDNKIYFFANDGIHGTQLWSSDGTSNNTQQITNLPGLNAFKLTRVGDQLFFLTTTGDYLLNVWKTNGTSTGTVLVESDLPLFNNPSYEGESNGLFYFFFQPYGENEGNLWRSDGSSEGTFPITDLIDGNGAGPGGTSSLTQYIEFNNELYFVARSHTIFSSSNSVGIMKTDGTREGTIPVKSIHNGRLISFADVHLANNKMFFSFFEADYNRLFIWESDGTETGTSLIYDESGSKFFAPSNLNSTASDLIFTSANTEGETALFTMNLNSYEVSEIKELAKNIKDPIIPTGTYWTTRIDKLDNSSFHILVYHEDFHSWYTDLTSQNTVEIEDLGIHEFTNLDDNLYFANWTQNEGKELWKTNLDFTQSTIVKNINTSRHGLDRPNLNFSAAELNNSILFSANDGISGYELWSYDIAKNATNMIKDLVEGESPGLPRDLIRYNDLVIFRGLTPALGSEPWRSDGTAEGTIIIEDIHAGGNYSTPSYFTIGNDKLFFTGSNNFENYLYTTDGYEIQEIKHLGLNIFGSPYSLDAMVGTDKNVFFSLNEAASLWISDGTETGTYIVQDFLSIDHLTSVGAKVFFVAIDNGSEKWGLWQSDGTTDGTYLIKDFENDYTNYPADLIEFNGVLVFTAHNTSSGREYWKSDGTQEGTIQLSDINPGVGDGAQNSGYAVLDDYLYFSANDVVHGTELWRANASFTEIELAQDINIGSDGSFPKNLFSDGKSIYFSAFTPASGFEFWSSKGHTPDNNQLYDLIAGSQGSFPYGFISVDNEVYFNAETPNHGRQLWTTLNGIGHVLNTNIIKQNSLRLYPNPTSEYIHISGIENSGYDLNIYDLKGRKMAIKQNSTHEIYIGDLSPGMYILTAESSLQKIVEKFIIR